MKIHNVNISNQYSHTEEYNTLSGEANTARVSFKHLRLTKCITDARQFYEFFKTPSSSEYILHIKYLYEHITGT